MSEFENARRGQEPPRPEDRIDSHPKSGVEPTRSLTPSRDLGAVVTATTDSLRERLGLRRGVDTHTLCQSWQRRAFESGALKQLIDDPLLSEDALGECLESLLSNWPPPSVVRGLPWRRRREVDPKELSALAVRLDSALNRLAPLDRERMVVALLSDFFGTSYEGGALGGSSRLARRSKRFRGPSPSAASTNWW